MAGLFDLSGKVAMVVGVGGIGCAQALGFADCGANVVLADLNLEHLETVADEIRAKGNQALPVTVNVTQEQSVTDMVKKTLEVFPRIDILVNTAGINIRRPAHRGFSLLDVVKKPFRVFRRTDINATGTGASQPASAISLFDEWQQVMDVNTRGTFLCCQAVGQVMIKQQSGKIINLSSVRGRYATLGGGGVYCISKGAVDTLTRTLACEWAKYNVLVNAIAPTVVETDFTRTILANRRGANALKASIPLGRWAIPADIVGPTLFFASKASDFVTGQVLYIDGGLTSWT
ncbi:SDR family NAD(P)-dependent oxidoreductase [Chloroflexota bacterium]